jgi:prepilin-type N-terminal cleavage/methylation domain-containing protein
LYVSFTTFYLRRTGRRLKSRVVRDVGFTLTELVITMLVLGVLASIAIPSFLGSRNNSYDKEAQASIEVVLRAARLLYQSQGDFSTGSSAQCGDSALLAADLQKLEPGIDVVASSVSSTNSRVVSVQAVQTWNSNAELLGCQGFYAVALSSSGSCWAARIIVEGKFLRSSSVSPVVVAQQTNTSNKAITTWTALPVNGTALGVLKPQTSAADGNNTNNLASIKTYCKAKEQSTGSPTVDGLIIAPSQFYATWRDVAPGGTTSNVNGEAAAEALRPVFTLSSSSESVVQNVAVSGYTITSTGVAIASYAISPSAPTGTSFSTSTGLLSGTPTTVQSATAYTITATTAASYTRTATFTLTVTASATGTPSITRRVYGDTQVTVTVAAGTGGTPSSYTVSASPQVSGVTRTCTVTGASGSCIVTGLTNGVAYTFSATASNALGTSSASSASLSTTPYSAAGRAAAEVAAAGTGTLWTSRTATTGYWMSVEYGGGLFVATGDTAIMTSPDGVTWTARTSPTSEEWWDVTYGGGTWVAVGYGGRVMSSSNGFDWTQRGAPSNDYYSVTYGNGLFVAVSEGGGTSQIITSPDGTTWTSRTSPISLRWHAVAYGNGLFVAVARTGDGTNQVMTSPDGFTWTARTSAASGDWRGVGYGNGLWVATKYGDDQVMTSPDGITWTARSIPGSGQSWTTVIYGNGVWVAVAESSNSGAERVMTSPDGITWTMQQAAGDDSKRWFGLAYGGGKFVAVALASGLDNVMTG